MASAYKPQPIVRKKPVDQWSTRERLALASSVCRSGDQNWVSVSRAIRPFAEAGRRSDWFSQKNCALQYADLLEKVETPKRKRSEKGEIIETPGLQIVRKLSHDRVEEIKARIADSQHQYRKLKTEIEMVSSGHCDEKLADIWEQIQLRQKEKDEKAAAAQRALDEERRARAAQKGRLQQPHASNTSADFDDSSTQDSVLSDSVDVEELQASAGNSQTTGANISMSTQHQPPSLMLAGSSASVDSKSRDTPPPPPSQLLTTLLQKKTPLDITSRRKDDGSKQDGVESLLCPTPKKMDHQPVQLGVTPSAGAPTLTMLLNTPNCNSALSVRTTASAVAPAATATAGATAVAAGSSVTNISPAATVCGASALPAAVVPAATCGVAVPLAASVVLAPSVALSNMLTLPTHMAADQLPATVSAPLPPTIPLADISADAAPEMEVTAPTGVLTPDTQVAAALLDIPMAVELSQTPQGCVDLDEAAALLAKLIDDETAAGVAAAAIADSEAMALDEDMEICSVSATKEIPTVVSLVEGPEQDVVIAEQRQELTETVEPSELANTVELETIVVQQPQAEPVLLQLSSTQLAADVLDAAAAATSATTMPDVMVAEPTVALNATVPDIADIPADTASCSAITEVLPEEVEHKQENVRPPSPEAAQPLPVDKHPGRAVVSKHRAADAGVHIKRRGPRGFRKVQAAANSQDRQVGEQPVAATVAADEVPAPAVAAFTSDVAHKQLHEEAVVQLEEVKTEGQRALLEEIASSEVKKEDTSSAMDEPKRDSKALNVEEAAPLGGHAVPGIIDVAAAVAAPADLANPRQLTAVAGSSVESLPGSPASVLLSDDSEEEKSYKIWRKAITLVWRSVANHKFANVFLHPVTDDIAPGYTSCVYRPMDLQTIKRNLESGIIRTTAEFQREMMLMFTNAIMYNNTDHDVYKMATEMYDDAMQHIEQFVHTQLMLKEQETKVVSLRGRRDATDKDDDRRRSGFESSEGGKRKRLTRADDDK